jgi:hypothetical protein
MTATYFRRFFPDDVGSADKSLEIAVIDSYFAFWQYQKQADCATIPPAGASAAAVFAFYDKVESLNTYSDQELAPYVPYYYRASVQLGSLEAYDGYTCGACSATLVPTCRRRSYPSRFRYHISTISRCRTARLRLTGFLPLFRAGRQPRLQDRTTSRRSSSRSDGDLAPVGWPTRCAASIRSRVDA